MRVQGLHDLMYTSLPVNINTGFCFRVANATHELGCSGWTGRTGKPLVRAKALPNVHVDGDFVVVASAQELLPLLQVRGFALAMSAVPEGACRGRATWPPDF